MHLTSLPAWELQEGTTHEALAVVEGGWANSVHHSANALLSSSVLPPHGDVGLLEPLASHAWVAIGRKVAGRAAASAFLEGPLLGKVRLRLLYQTPEIYKTDVAAQMTPKLLGWKHACAMPDDRGVGEVGFPHPEIVFNGAVSAVHVHLEDTKTGDVYWDADFALKPDILWNVLGKSRLTKTAVARNPGDVFRKPCVANDENEPHFFELTVQTQDGTYDDNVTPWGELEGFKKFRGPKASIGFEAYRLPELEPENPLDPSEQKEIVGEWKRGGHYSRGPVHHSRLDRVLYGEEDPFYDPKTGDTGRGYYHHIIKPSARSRRMWEYLDKYAPPALTVPAVEPEPA